jgi:adenine-specific DNA-methyltransferase
MVNRLRLAKNLLADKGVIFISIDDNEQAYLRILCNQIFGEDNFINCIVLKTKASAGASGGGEDKGLKKNKEYLLMYSKSSNDLDIQKQYIEVKLTDYIKERRDKEIGFYYTRILFNDGKENLLGEKDEMKIYEHKNFTFLTINEVMKKDKLSEEDVYLKYFDKIFMVTNAQTSLPEKVIQFANGGKQKLLSYVYKPTSGKSKGNEIRKYIWNNTLVVWLKDSAIKKNNTIFKKVELGDLWSDISWGRLDLEGDVVFKNGKKPISLIKRLIDMKQNDAIVLDYFAGSGTTGHAVLDANKEDGGTRQFILCTYNENKIAEDVTYPRIKKVINGYGETAGIPANLRYFQTDFVAKGKNNDQTRTYLVASAVDMINVREATYEKIEVKKEYVLTQSATTFTAIIFDSFKLADIWKEIEKKNTGKLPVKLYIFSFSDDTSAFTDMIPKSTKLDWESKSIPEGILQVYQRLFKKKDK